MVELFEAALEQIMNERISTMFAQGFIFTRSPQQDGEMAVSSVRGDIVVDYSAEMKTDETTVNFAAFTTFLQKYLPLFPDSAFNPRAVSANYERFLGERGNFLFVMTRFQQANQFLLERLARQDPRLNLDMLKASDTIATLLNAICSHGFIYLTLEATQRAATILQPVSRSDDPTRHRFRGESHDHFWVLLPKAMQESHLGLSREIYQLIYNRRIRDALNQPDAPTAPVVTWRETIGQVYQGGLHGVVSGVYQGVASYIAPAAEEEQEGDFAASGTLLDAVFQVLQARNIEVYQGATEATRKKTAAFLLAVDKEIKKAAQRHSKTSKYDKLESTLEMLDALSAVLVSDKINEQKVQALEELIAQNRSSVALPEDPRIDHSLAKELVKRFDQINPEDGTPPNKLPFTVMLQATCKQSCALMASELAETPKEDIDLTDVNDRQAIHKELSDKLLQLHGALSQKEAYKKYFSLEKLFTEGLSQAQLPESFRQFSSIWLSATGIPLLPKPGWAKDVATVWRERDNADEFKVILTLATDKQHLMEWNMQSLAQPDSRRAR